MSAKAGRKAENMMLLCEIGGLALAGLFILFLVIDVAIIRVGKIVEKRDNSGCHRTIRKTNRMNKREHQSSASAARKARV